MELVPFLAEVFEYAASERASPRSARHRSLRVTY